MDLNHTEVDYNEDLSLPDSEQPRRKRRVKKPIHSFDIDAMSNDSIATELRSESFRPNPCRRKTVAPRSRLAGRRATSTATPSKEKWAASDRNADRHRWCERYENLLPLPSERYSVTFARTLKAASANVQYSRLRMGPPVPPALGWVDGFMSEMNSSVFRRCEKLSTSDPWELAVLAVRLRLMGIEAKVGLADNGKTLALTDYEGVVMEFPDSMPENLLTPKQYDEADSVRRFMQNLHWVAKTAQEAIDSKRG